MLEAHHFDQISAYLPFLQPANTPLARDFSRAAYYARIPSGRDIFMEGDHINGIALMMSGTVRVYKIGETGREITLYRFGEGESCVITANAILNTTDFPAIAVVEQDAEAIMIPADVFADWVRRYDAWRQFVFNLNAQRLSAIMQVVDEVAFQRMDRRIATFLLDRSRESNPISVTHQVIANELGSSREVISRLLVDFAARDLIRSSRGEIEVLDRDLLEKQVVL